MTSFKPIQFCMLNIWCYKTKLVFQWILIGNTNVSSWIFEIWGRWGYLKYSSESGEKDKRTFRYVRTHPKKLSWPKHYTVFLPKLENFENYILRKKSRRDNYSFYDWKVLWWVLNHVRVTIEYLVHPSSPYPASKIKIHKFYFSDTTKICGFQKYDILYIIDCSGYLRVFFDVKLYFS